MSIGSAAGPSALEALPFHVFLLVAACDGEIAVKEVEVFQRMLASTSWCRSGLAKAILPRTAERYTALWKEHAGRGEPVEMLRAALCGARRHVPEGDRDGFAEDLSRLAVAVARASGGVFGIGAVSREERRALEVLDQLLSEELAPRESRTSVELAGPSGGTEWSGLPVWTKGRIAVRCTAVIDEARDVKTFRFTGVEPCQFSYQPGQFLTLELTVGDLKILRSYTIASSPSRPHAIEVTVKRIPGGRASSWLHENLRPGDVVHVAGPAGVFSWARERPEKVLMISGGSGITPVMSMARFLHDTAEPVDVVFLHSARSAEDRAFREELELFERRMPRFRVAWTFTKEPPEGWCGARGRVCLELLRREVPDFMERTVYLCGPSPFMSEVRRVLEAAAFPMDRYHAESFGGAPAAAPSSEAVLASLMRMFPAPEEQARAARVPAAPKAQSSAARGGPRDARAPRVVFAKSGQEAATEGRTVLEVAEALGIAIPNACRAGVCGTCRISRISGEVDMSGAEAIDATDDAHLLACMAKPKGRVEVDA